MENDVPRWDGLFVDIFSLVLSPLVQKYGEIISAVNFQKEEHIEIIQIIGVITTFMIAELKLSFRKKIYSLVGSCLCNCVVNFI